MLQNVCFLYTIKKTPTRRLRKKKSLFYVNATSRGISLEINLPIFRLVLDSWRSEKCILVLP